jgi:hypothetical protein
MRFWSEPLPRQLQLAESEMAERIDVEVTGKSQFEVAYDMARFILINMEGRRVKSLKRQELLHLVAEHRGLARHQGQGDCQLKSEAGACRVPASSAEITSPLSRHVPRLVGLANATTAQHLSTA